MDNDQLMRALRAKAAREKVKAATAPLEKMGDHAHSPQDPDVKRAPFEDIEKQAQEEHDRRTKKETTELVRNSA